MIISRIQIMMPNPKMTSMHHNDSVQEPQLEYMHKGCFRIILQTQTTKVEMSHYDCFCVQGSNLLKIWNAGVNLQNIPRHQDEFRL